MLLASQRAQINRRQARPAEQQYTNIGTQQIQRTAVADTESLCTPQPLFLYSLPKWVNGIITTYLAIHGTVEQLWTFSQMSLYISVLILLTKCAKRDIILDYIERKIQNKK